MGRNKKSGAIPLPQTGFTREDTNAAKGVAALLLVCHHLFWKVIDPSAPTANSPFLFLTTDQTPLHMLGVAGKACVSTFLLLSAYGMSVQYGKLCASGAEDARAMARGTERFALRRAFTLMSGYWFVYALAFIAACFTKNTPAAVYGDMGFLAGFVDFMGLANFFGTPTLNATWWYMTLALALIFALPLLFRCGARYGLLMLLGLFLILRNLFSVPPYICAYTLSAAIGVYCAQTDFFVKFRDAGRKRPGVQLLKAVLLALCIVGLTCLRYRGEFTYEMQLYHLTDPLLALCVVLFCFVVLCARPWLRRPFAFIGVHSMNIFLTHTLIYAQYFNRFVFSLKYPPLVFLAVLLLSLGVSVVLEWLKKTTHYYALTEKIKARLA